MKRLRLTALAFVLVAAGAAISARAEAPTVAAAAQDWRSVDRTQLFDAVVETIAQRFFDETLLRDIDWKERAQAARASVLAAPTPEAAVAAINALLGELKTSHTALLTPDEYTYYFLLDIVGAGRGGAAFMQRKFWGTGPYYPGIGAFTRVLEGKHFVDGVLEGSPAERTGLRYGDELVSVDGAPYSPIAAFRDKLGRSVTLAYRRAADAPLVQAAVDVVPMRPRTAFAMATEQSARVIERGGKRIGYVHVWQSAEADSFRNALAKIDPGIRREGRRRGRGESEADTRQPLDFLIVDMRGRVGGTTSVSAQQLNALEGREQSYWGQMRFSGRSGTRNAGEGERQGSPFRGRSVLLIDRTTRSAAEIMAHGFKRSGFGPVIGTPTAGAVTAGSTAVMPGDLLLYIAVTGLAFDGETLEGKGVAPDVTVERSLPYAAGTDPVLDAAVERLAGRESQ